MCLTFGLLLCCVQTPLHRAAYEGYPDVVLLLLEHGADPTLKDVCVMCDGWGSCVWMCDGWGDVCV